MRNRRGRSSSLEELVQNENDGEVAGDNELDTGVLDTISQQFESLDYFTNYSSLLLDEIRIRGYKFVVRKVGFFTKYNVYFLSIIISGCSTLVDNVVSWDHHRPHSLLY